MALFPVSTVLIFKRARFSTGVETTREIFVGLGDLLLIGHSDNSMEWRPGCPYDAGNGKRKAAEQFQPAG
jgi:hypothetical protein